VDQFAIFANLPYRCASEVDFALVWWQAEHAVVAATDNPA
jgi:hypothetical protein